jgi:hypothetical protein
MWKLADRNNMVTQTPVELQKFCIFTCCVTFIISKKENIINPRVTINAKHFIFRVNYIFFF